MDKQELETLAEEICHRSDRLQRRRMWDWFLASVCTFAAFFLATRINLGASNIRVVLIIIIILFTFLSGFFIGKTTKKARKEV